MKVLIAGGGIGGLTAALCLHHHCIDTVLFEQAESLTEVGAGIQISPNAMRILMALGLGDAILRAGFCPQALEMRDGKQGNTIFAIPLGDAARTRWGAPYVQIHRADLIEILANAVQTRMQGTVHSGAAVTGYSNGAAGDRVCVRLSNGQDVTGDVLIGADGIHSKVRETMQGPQQPRFTGQVAWRATVPADQLGRHRPPPTACAWTGPGKHAVTYWLRGGTLANFVGVVERSDWREEGWSIAGDRDQVLADFAGWHPIITSLIAEASSHYRWALLDRKPLSQWHDSRAVLLGDACHPMLPFLAQGGAMAIEDGWVLAALLNQFPSDLPSALTRYQALRQPRTTRVQAAAKANAAHFHARSPLGRVGEHGMLFAASRLNPARLAAQWDWLYGWDGKVEPRSGRSA